MSTPSMITYWQAGKRYAIYHAKDNLQSPDRSYRPVTIHMMYQHPKTAQVIAEGYIDLASYVPSNATDSEVVATWTARSTNQDTTD